MSLYTHDEVCKGCVNARWMHGLKRTAFDFCAVNAEDEVDGVSGKCPQRQPSPAQTPEQEP